MSSGLFRSDVRTAITSHFFALALYRFVFRPWSRCAAVWCGARGTDRERGNRSHSGLPTPPFLAASYSKNHSSVLCFLAPLSLLTNMTRSNRQVTCHKDKQKCVIASMMVVPSSWPARAGPVLAVALRWAEVWSNNTECTSRRRRWPASARGYLLLLR